MSKLIIIIIIIIIGVMFDNCYLQISQHDG